MNIDAIILWLMRASGFVVMAALCIVGCCMVFCWMTDQILRAFGVLEAVTTWIWNRKRFYRWQEEQRKRETA